MRHKNQNNLTRYPCKHCKIRKRNRGYGLCDPCHNNDNIRYKYQKIAGPQPCQSGGIALDNVERPPPPTPTDVPPGMDRVAIYAARLEAGFGLWHPDDSKLNPHYAEEDE